MPTFLTVNKVFERQNTFVDDELNDFCSDASSMWRKIVRSYVRPFRSFTNALHSIMSFFPFLVWVPEYKWRKQLPGDVIGGVMGGILNITQGIAYSVLAGLPPASGLYTTFFGAFTYPFLSSWPHGAMAPFAIIELMCGTASDSLYDNLFVKNNSRFYSIDQLHQINSTTIVCTLTFMVGVICLLFALLRVQFLAQYFSEPLVSGFVTAAAIHVLFSQIDTILGFTKPKSGGFGYLFREIVEIIFLLPKVKWVTLLMSVCSFIFLYSTKCYLHAKLIKWSGRKLVIPYELILVAATTAIVYFFDLEIVSEVKIVGEIPRGLPAPEIPRFFLIQPLIWDAMAIAVVHIALHLSIAKVMCIKKKYKVDENQELYAVGTVLAASSVFPVFPGSSGLGRPVLLAECGATTQLANIFSGLVVLVVLLALGPLFYCLPLCVLSIIVIFVLRSFFGGFWELPRFWRASRWDFCIWMVTFCATIITDLIFGLGIGVGFELFTVVARSQWPRWKVRFPKRTGTADVCVFQFEAMLLFTNAERFKKVVWTSVKEMESEDQFQRTFIFDCSGITDLDTVGLTVRYLQQAFAQVVKELRSAGCSVFFAGCPDSLIPKLQEAGAWQSEKEVFPNAEDATLQARLIQGNISTVSGSLDKECLRRVATIQYS
ncbi:hypothetical protein M3Y97_01074200 [Aphelenchoides bicaudatus]|nr:hypothetical protein M3Y97_01074200 [Aphelenchoides bicaudatus]